MKPFVWDKGSIERNMKKRRSRKKHTRGKPSSAVKGGSDEPRPCERLFPPHPLLALANRALTLRSIAGGTVQKPRDPLQSIGRIGRGFCKTKP